PTPRARRSVPRSSTVMLSALILKTTTAPIGMTGIWRDVGAWPKYSLVRQGIDNEFRPFIDSIISTEEAILGQGLPHRSSFVRKRLRDSESLRNEYSAGKCVHPG